MKMALGRRMSVDQETEVKAAIVKVVGRETMTSFPEVRDAMESLDPYIGDLEFLILLDEICTNQERTLSEDIHAAQDRL